MQISISSEKLAELARQASAQIIEICRLAWGEGLMPGWSGNASLRLSPEFILITASGAAKGSLRPENCLLAGKDGTIIGEGHPSSETALHFALYGADEDCQAILHAHPPNLQALDIVLTRTGEKNDDEYFNREFLKLPLFEARVWRQRLFAAPALPPGSNDLARAAASCLPESREVGDRRPRAVWLRRHGLCALGAGLAQCLCMTEELEHLAKVQLAAMNGLRL